MSVLDIVPLGFQWPTLDPFLFCVHPDDAYPAGNDKLVITTTTPPPIPTPQDPLIARENWSRFGTTSTSSERARIQDLLEAFKALNVPVRDQIQILAQIHQTGRLHAKFVRE